MPVQTLKEITGYAERWEIPLLIENMNRIPQTPAGKPWDLSFEQPEVSYLGITVEELEAVYSKVSSPMLGFSLNVAHGHLLQSGFLPFLEAFGANWETYRSATTTGSPMSTCPSERGLWIWQFDPGVEKERLPGNSEPLRG